MSVMEGAQVDSKSKATDTVQVRPLQPHMHCYACKCVHDYYCTEYN